MIHDPATFFIQLVALVTQYRTALLFLVCVGLGAAGAWLIAGMAFRERLLDIPNERSSHTVPTPRGAGVGILAAFIVAGLTLRIPTTFLFAAILISCHQLIWRLFPDLGDIASRHPGSLDPHSPFSRCCPV